MRKETPGNSLNSENDYKVWFIAGGEAQDEKFNVFTGSFINLMQEILGDKFSLVKGVYFLFPAQNVTWALNNAQIPVTNPDKRKIIQGAFLQITEGHRSSDTEIIITSSSYGSVVAAQVACCLAERNRNREFFRNPFHLVLGTSMISKESELFRKLVRYQASGMIGRIIYDELQDKDDNSAGIGGVTRAEAWRNALRIMVPFFSRKVTGPSFLNTHPVKGHLHRRRSKTVKKAIDFIDVILIKNRLAGDQYKELAVNVLGKLLDEDLQI